MKINVTNIYVDDQGKPLSFYAEVLGFARKTRGAEFTMPPTDVTGSIITMLKATCGNLIQLTQLAPIDVKGEEDERSRAVHTGSGQRGEGTKGPGTN